MAVVDEMSNDLYPNRTRHRARTRHGRLAIVLSTGAADYALRGCASQWTDGGNGATCGVDPRKIGVPGTQRASVRPPATCSFIERRLPDDGPTTFPAVRGADRLRTAWERLGRGARRRARHL